MTLTATSGSVSHTANLSLTIVATSAGMASVNLAPYYNVSGIAVDNLPFTGGGLDAGGRSYSGVSLGASQNVGSVLYGFGPMGAPDAVSGQTVTLPAGKFTTLKILAAGVNGSQTGQTFTVKYTDGTTTQFTQSLSDWCNAQNYPGEAQAVPMNYRDNSTGTFDVRISLPVRLYLHSEQHQNREFRQPAAESQCGGAGDDADGRHERGREGGHVGQRPTLASGVNRDRVHALYLVLMSPESG